MNLRYCTLTGADNTTSLSDIEQLSKRYPFAEWGLLYNPALAGTGRFPSTSTIGRLLDDLSPPAHIALHLCGKSVSAFLSAEPGVSCLVRQVCDRGGRVQLNFSQRRRKLNLDLMCERFAEHPGGQFITQIHNGNSNVWVRLADCPNHSVLFDGSGGKGLLPEAWPDPLPRTYCGYAGGLGPANLQRELPLIAERANGAAFWIDMEASLRTEVDAFDLLKAEACLEIVGQHLDGSAAAS